MKKYLLLFLCVFGGEARAQSLCAMYCPAVSDRGVCKLEHSGNNCSCTCELVNFDATKRADIEDALKMSVGPHPGMDGLLTLSPTWPNDVTTSGDAASIKDLAPAITARTQMDHPAHQPMDDAQITADRIERQKIIEAAGKLLDSMRGGKRAP